MVVVSLIAVLLVAEAYNQPLVQFLTPVLSIIHTHVRSQRGKKVPEGLTTTEEISNFHQLATHPVRLSTSCNLLCGYYNVMYGVCMHACMFVCMFVCLYICVTVGLPVMMN